MFLFSLCDGCFLGLCRVSDTLEPPVHRAVPSNPGETGFFSQVALEIFLECFFKAIFVFKKKSVATWKFTRFTWITWHTVLCQLYYYLFNFIKNIIIIRTSCPSRC